MTIINKPHMMYVSFALMILLSLFHLNRCEYDCDECECECPKPKTKTKYVVVEIPKYIPVKKTKYVPIKIKEGYSSGGYD